MNRFIEVENYRNKNPPQEPPAEKDQDGRYFDPDDEEFLGMTPDEFDEALQEQF